MIGSGVKGLKQGLSDRLFTCRGNVNALYLRSICGVQQFHTHMMLFQALYVGGNLCMLSVYLRSAGEPAPPPLPQVLSSWVCPCPSINWQRPKCHGCPVLWSELLGQYQPHVSLWAGPASSASAMQLGSSDAFVVSFMPSADCKWITLHVEL